jgi:hypothetical protein
MPEIGTSGSMSGDGKRSVAAWPKLPRPSSTLPKAAVEQTSVDGSNVPLPDSYTAASLFDHLVGALLQEPRHLQPKRLGGLKVDDQLEFRRLLHGEIGRLRAPEDLRHDYRGLPP